MASLELAANQRTVKRVGLGLPQVGGLLGTSRTRVPPQLRHCVCSSPRRKTAASRNQSLCTNHHQLDACAPGLLMHKEQEQGESGRVMSPTVARCTTTQKRQKQRQKLDKEFSLSPPPYRIAIVVCSMLGHGAFACLGSGGCAAPVIGPRWSPIKIASALSIGVHENIIAVTSSGVISSVDIN